jgi:DNA-binding response OmpR family regulator
VDHLREQGLELHAAGTAAEAHRLAHQFKPTVLVLDADLPGESGYLTCAKLKTQQPEARVILLGSRRPADARKFARFVGAETLLHPDEGFANLLDRILVNA